MGDTGQLVALDDAHIQGGLHRIGACREILAQGRAVSVVVALEHIAVRRHIPRVVQNASLPAQILDIGHTDRSRVPRSGQGAYGGNVMGDVCAACGRHVFVGAYMHAGHMSQMTRYDIAARGQIRMVLTHAMDVSMQ